MNRDRDPGQRDDEPEAEEYDEDGPRSIFSALWFRALLAVLVLGVLAAVAVPYVLDLATHSTSDSAPTKRPASGPASAVTPPAATARPATVAASSAPPAPAQPSPAPPAVATPSPSEPPTAAESAPPTAAPARVTPSVAPIKQPAKRVDTPNRPRVVAATRPAAAK